MAATFTLTASGAGGDPATWGKTGAAVAGTTVPTNGDTILLPGTSAMTLIWDKTLSDINPGSLTINSGAGTLTTTVQFGSGNCAFTLPAAQTGTAGAFVGTLTGAVKFVGSPKYLERTSGTTLIAKGV